MFICHQRVGGRKGWVASEEQGRGGVLLSSQDAEGQGEEAVKGKARGGAMSAWDLVCSEHSLAEFITQGSSRSQGGVEAGRGRVGYCCSWQGSEKEEGLSPHNGGLGSCGKEEAGSWVLEGALNDILFSSLETEPCLFYSLTPSPNSQFPYSHLGFQSLGLVHQSWPWAAAGRRQVPRRETREGRWKERSPDNNPHLPDSYLRDDPTCRLQVEAGKTGRRGSRRKERGWMGEEEKGKHSPFH